MYKSDKRGFQQTRWEDLTAKERDYWRARVQQWDQDRDELRPKKKKHKGRRKIGRKRDVIVVVFDYAFAFGNKFIIFSVGDVGICSSSAHSHAFWPDSAMFSCSSLDTLSVK